MLPTWGQQFNIDAWGNLYSVTAISGYPVIGAFTATASTSNQLSCTSVCSTSYDTAGNTISNGSGAITYDAENRILTTNGVTYTYDGDGKRVEKSSGTLYWTGVGSEALSESTLSGTINEEYVFFNGERVSKIDRPSDTVHAFLFDHLGSSRMSVVPSGSETLTVEEDLDYTPYGIVAYGTPTDHYQFDGKEYDSESGLNNFGARYNASTVGRFMTPDWEAKPTDVPYAKFGDPQTLNLYSFVENGPINRIDPDGHCPPCAIVLEGLVEEGAIAAWNYVAGVTVLGTTAAVAGGNGNNVSSLYYQAKFANASSNTAPTSAPQGNPAPGTQTGTQAGSPHAPGDVPDGQVVVRGGQGAIPSSGTYSGAQGATIEEAGKGVPNGTVSATTGGGIRAAGGEVRPAPEAAYEGGPINGQHVNITGGQSSFGPPQANPAPKSERVPGGKTLPKPPEPNQ